MNEITEPLRLAIGSHSAGSGKGCAMNVVSWENGDTQITDFPGCSHRVLARMVQRVNDTICKHTNDQGILCSECSITVLNLAHRTVGTNSITDLQLWKWLLEFLDSSWGIINYATNDRSKQAISTVARLCEDSSKGVVVTKLQWQCAATVAYAAAAYADDAATAAYAAAAYDDDAYDDAAFVDKAIDAWERITDKQALEIKPQDTENAIKKMLYVK